MEVSAAAHPAGKVVAFIEAAENLLEGVAERSGLHRAGFGIRRMGGRFAPRFHRLGKRGIVRVERFELGRIDLHEIEPAAVSLGGGADPVDGPIGILADRFQLGDAIHPARRQQRAAPRIEFDLAPLELVGERIAEQFIALAAVVLFEVAAETGEPAEDRFNPAALAGMALFALTNWSAETYPHAEQLYGFLGRFRAVVVSGRIGLIKPDAAIYRHAIARFGVAPERTLFIDDSAKNVAGAAAVGLRAIRFTTPDALLRDLAALGLPIGA